MRPLTIAALLVYAFGAYAYGATLVLWFRQRAGVGRTGQPLPTPVEAGISAVGLLWFLVSILLTLRSAVPGSRPWVLQSVLLCLAFAFPPLILHGFYAAACHGNTLRRPRAWAIGVGVHYAQSALVAGAALVAFWGALVPPRRIVL